MQLKNSQKTHMAHRKIVGIEVEIAADNIDYQSFSSKQSLLDYDVILFRPFIDEYLGYPEYFKGKPSLNEKMSFGLIESCHHWAREIKQAYENGKTIIIFLSELNEIYIETGEYQFSGTGRNEKRTSFVKEYNNYNSIPASISPLVTRGSSIKLASPGGEIFSTYWSDFEKFSRYEVLLNLPKESIGLITTSGEKTVGGVMRSKAHAGAIVFLPNIDFTSDDFFEVGDDNELDWNSEGELFGKKFSSSIIALDSALRKNSEITPEPNWATADQYFLRPEIELRTQLVRAEEKIEQAHAEKNAISAELASASRYRALLYENGKSLENSIIDALHLMGFSAATYKDAKSEFDVVFECEEGRLIGEAEGKDNKAINIDKIRQLNENIHEDLAREEVTNAAKPVLFGNAYRLLPLQERGNPFTEKCYQSASLNSVALVSTSDMFAIVQYLLTKQDAVFAAACRSALFNSVGRVLFPSIPKSEE